MLRVKADDGEHENEGHVNIDVSDANDVDTRRCHRTRFDVVVRLVRR
jgi:hypothetical protein